MEHAQMYGLSDYISSEIIIMQRKTEKEEAHTRTIGYTITSIKKEYEALDSNLKDMFWLYYLDTPIRQARLV